MAITILLNDDDMEKLNNGENIIISKYNNPSEEDRGCITNNRNNYRSCSDPFSDPFYNELKQLDLL